MPQSNESDAAVRPSVLVVDDEPANLDTFRRVFRHDLAMRLCAQPSEALEALESGSFDLVIVDHAMPEMTGVQLLEAVREKAPESGRIVVTGYPDVREVRDAARSGLTATVIMKPWKRDEIVRWARHFQKVRGMRAELAKARARLGGDDGKG